MSAHNYPPPAGQFFPPPAGGQSSQQPNYPPPPSHAPPAQQHSPAPVQYATPPQQQQFSPPPQQKPSSLPFRDAAAAPAQFAAPPQQPVAQPVAQAEATPTSPSGPQMVSHIDDVGSFNGGAYRVSHRDTNSVLTIQLAIGCPIHAKPGSMIAMSPSVTLKGEMKFSMKKLMTGGSMTMSTFVGPGELLLAPATLGDVTSIRLSGQEVWSVGKDAFLAATDRVQKEYKSQGISKAMFSGEGWFTYKISGSGIMWVSSFGAIIRKDLQEGEKYIIDNGHLVAWNCPYIIERIASGGIISNMAAGEGLVCKFTGPGSIFMQTRNPMAMAMLLTGQKAAM